VFYTYDLEHYRDDLRGFYFDLAAIAPGPMVRTSSELVEALREIDGDVPEPTEAYARFRKTFCELEDGHATDRVLDLLLTPGQAAASTH